MKTVFVIEVVQSCLPDAELQTMPVGVQQDIDLAKLALEGKVHPLPGYVWGRVTRSDNSRVLTLWEPRYDPKTGAQVSHLVGRIVEVPYA
jgi:hypothetical protein